jgi:anti-anti-sigma regulatory factor
VIVDLSAVSFMDTAGLRALVRARERMDSAGRWLLTRGATGQPRRLLEIGRVHYGLTL